MKKLVEITSHTEIIEKIIGQFVFMKLMSEPEDSNFLELFDLNLNDIFKKADEFFIDFTDDLGMIISEDVNLSSKITEFLKEWSQIVDVTAIQQNVHYQLYVLDKYDSKIEKDTYKENGALNENFNLN